MGSKITRRQKVKGMECLTEIKVRKEVILNCEKLSEYENNENANGIVLLSILPIAFLSIPNTITKTLAVLLLVPTIFLFSKRLYAK